ncbi:hypothetical protein ASD88_11895 [Pelomonas sp. Root662]|nr:hypothetical protein ASC81_11895 [Pelomonas sp. Root405]KRA72729.1 hypothetical protein ASD88_11895 [Pelomonas sp. Root662]
MPSRHNQQEHRQVSRYLVVIDSSGGAVAKLFLDSREQVGEFDASTEEVAVMTRNASASSGATGAEWDKALAGHSTQERAAATVYQLDV